MSVSSHLAVSPAAYDRRIRQLILFYDELVAEAACAVRYAERPVRTILDLGIGTGALARACLEHTPRARVVGIDADPAMMSVARNRLRRWRRRVTMFEGDFVSARLPRADAIVTSYALHHIKSTRAKQAFYRRCFLSLKPGGVLISGDCAPASSAAAAETDLHPWLEHLAQSTGDLTSARRMYESWGGEDTYLPLETELRLLRRAGFSVEVPWRRAPFAVLVGTRHR